MEVKEAVKAASESKELKEARGSMEDLKLAHTFCVIEDGKQRNWEVGYYSEKHDKVVSFEVGRNKKVESRAPEEAFKEEGKIKELDMGKVKVKLEEALGKTDGHLKEKYSGETVTKKIIILQNLDKQLYNMTLVTSSFHIINVRIDASTGKILESAKNHIMGLGKRLK